MRTPTTPPGWRSRIAAAWHYRTYTLVFAVALTITGSLAVIHGDKVSAALSNLAADVVSRGMGGFMLAGGVITLIALLRGDTLGEAIGMCLMAVGAMVYGAGVIAGLGLAGMVAGPGYLAIAVGTIGRVIAITRTAGQVAARPPSPAGDPDAGG